MPHIEAAAAPAAEDRRKGVGRGSRGGERSAGCEEGKRKPQEKVSGWKEVRRKAKERQHHRARRRKSGARARSRGSYLYHPRGAHDAKKNAGRAATTARGIVFSRQAATLLMQNSSVLHNVMA